MRSWPSPDVPSLPGKGPQLWLRDTASGMVRPTYPGRLATLYVCGITPYDATHLGHAATYLAYDLVQRVWLDGGHPVHYVQNITDVDDPLLERAARDGVDWEELAAKEIQLFREDMAALRVLAPRDYVGAVEAMDEVSTAVARLLQMGAAYRVADSGHPDVYFDISAAPKFGYVSGYDASTMFDLAAARGGDPDRPGKRNPLDPLLWRMRRENEPWWDSPMGQGRPGWHIECSVIAGNRLGSTIDVQGGGCDLIFPHHECSAAHSEVLTGVMPFARHYSHAGMILLHGEKMSKSRGNLVLVSTLRAEGADLMAVRLGLLSGHYHADRAWTDELYQQSVERLGRWRAAAGRSGGDASELVDELRAALANDLDTPTALARLDRWASDGSEHGADVALAVDALLGIDLR